MATNIKATIKMFRVGELGDCFLLQFREGENNCNILIDCGSFRNSKASKDRMKAVVAEIKNQLKGQPLDVVVGTHQHNDHLSGFVHCEDDFEGMVKQVWLSWLDDPKDPMGRKIKKDQMNLVQQLKAIYNEMDKQGIAAKHETVNDVLGFFGASGNDPEIPAKGIEILKRIGQKEARYLSPGETIPLPGIDKNTVKVYVLGPPRNKTQLFDINPSKDETYDPGLAAAESNALRILSALENKSTAGFTDEEYQFPFDVSYKKRPAHADDDIKKIYNHRNEAWRKIDDAWLEGADRLALYLDSYTNNSSLVLAFELVKSGKVLLFAADAQTGNWSSWENIEWKKTKKGFNTYQLLENTVLYKVGHHCSHNATLVKALEAMTHPELVAMIPVDKNDPNITKKNGWKMPAKNLYKRLKEKTQHRVLRMDDGFADECKPTGKKAKWDQLKEKPKVEDLFVEYTIRG